MNSTNKYKAMTPSERLQYMASANRVTIGTNTQVLDHSLDTKYVAKIHGHIVSEGIDENGKQIFRYDTPALAHEAGWKMLNFWKEQAKKVNESNE